MAKGRVSKTRHDTGRTITMPSAYGSHRSMVVEHTQFGLELDDDHVLCKDDVHYYITEKVRLDNGLADPNRYGNSSATYEPQ